ncbi:hypothetical protein MT325_m527R [Paramecium bursaria chlorella virus MT325]|uniref:Uncharacterized protein m527R n=1 Tax=Paramecium bursaria Chlorella virus MT325 TaxID=346932 RepID=A7IUQ7_PBCVM|nr:hypothetical protein MT325_m527R [Paramecium bursaria chlorella virus MT325]
MILPAENPIVVLKLPPPPESPPTYVLHCPPVRFPPATVPIIVLLSPVVRSLPAEYPKIVLSEPPDVVAFPALHPIDVFLIPNLPA